MLEGLEISEIRLSQLENEGTIGAEYYAPEFLKPFELLQRSSYKKQPLKAICSLITDGDHGSAEYADEGVTFVLSEAVKVGWIDSNACRFITPRHAETLTRSRLVEGDVLVSKTGVYFGQSAVVTKDFVGANTIAHVGVIRLKRGTDPYFLSTFLNSKYGYTQLRRRGIKATRPEIKLLEFADISIPEVSIELVNSIRKTISASNIAKWSAENGLLEAEKLLLMTLGIAEFSPPTKTVSIEAINTSFSKTGRLDAEHYQPKYEALYQALAKNNRVFKLGDRLSFNQRGSQPDYRDAGLPVVNSKHVQRGEVMMGDTRFATLPDKTNAVIIQTGDVLMNGTGVGTIGRAAPYLHATQALPDNHVTVLRTDALSSICLALYLNSIAGQYQVEQHFKGSSGQIELYPADIANFWCPELDASVQKKIDALAQQSFTLKAQSQKLLEAAKRAVEIAIEQDEVTGMVYLAQQSKTV